MGATNEIGEKPAPEKPFDREAANGNDHCRTDHLDLGLQPRRAVRDLGRRSELDRHDPTGSIPGKHRVIAAM